MTTLPPALMHELAKQDIAERIEYAERYRLRREARRARTAHQQPALSARGTAWSARRSDSSGEGWWRRLTLRRPLSTSRTAHSGRSVDSLGSTTPAPVETERRERVDVTA